MRMQTCATCRHFVPNAVDLRIGQCRARAPVPLVAGMRQTPAGPAPVIDGFFAPVGRDIWCGDYGAKLTVMS